MRLGDWRPRYKPQLTRTRSEASQLQEMADEVSEAIHMLEQDLRPMAWRATLALLCRRPVFSAFSAGRPKPRSNEHRGAGPTGTGAGTSPAPAGSCSGLCTTIYSRRPADLCCTCVFEVACVYVVNFVTVTVPSYSKRDFVEYRTVPQIFLQVFRQHRNRP